MSDAKRCGQVTYIERLREAARKAFRTLNIPQDALRRPPGWCEDTGFAGLPEAREAMDIGAVVGDWERADSALVAQFRFLNATKGAPVASRVDSPLKMCHLRRLVALVSDSYGRQSGATPKEVAALLAKRKEQVEDILLGSGENVGLGYIAGLMIAEGNVVKRGGKKKPPAAKNSL